MRGLGFEPTTSSTSTPIPPTKSAKLNFAPGSLPGATTTIGTQYARKPNPQVWKRVPLW
jgi:hypothetical protein